MCVPRTRAAAATVEAGRNVALARPSKMQLPCRVIEAEVSRVPATVHQVCSYGPTPLLFHGTERKQSRIHVVGRGTLCFP